MDYQTLLAQIVNPALPGAVSNSSTPQAAADTLAIYIATLWRTAIVLGGIGVIIYLLVGGFYWITASGDKGKIEEAKNRIMHAIVGFAVLTSVAAVSVFLGQAFGLDLLKPNFGVLMTGGGAPGGGPPPGGGGFICPGGLTGGQTASDGGSGGYCTGGGAAMMGCFGPGQGVSGLNYPHLEPCYCISGTEQGGFDFSSC